MQANQRGRYDAAWTEIMRGEIPHADHHHGGHRDDGPATERVAGRDVGGRAAEAEHSGVVEAERKEQSRDRPAERRQPYTTTSREVSVAKSRKLPSNGPKGRLMLINEGLRAKRQGWHSTPRPQNCHDTGATAQPGLDTGS